MIDFEHNNINQLTHGSNDTRVVAALKKQIIYHQQKILCIRILYPIF